MDPAESELILGNVGFHRDSVIGIDDSVPVDILVLDVADIVGSKLCLGLLSISSGK